MAFIKIRQVKGVNKVYWCVRKRQSKKLGGDGKVKSVEYYLGKYEYLDTLSYTLEYIYWYLWDNSITLSDFIEQLVVFCFKKEHLIKVKNIFENKNFFGEEEIDYISFEIKNKKVYCRSLYPFIDLREKRYKYILNTINELIKDICSSANNFSNEIESIVNEFQSYNRKILLANRIKQSMNQDITGFYSDSYENICNLVDSSYERSENRLKELLNKIPPS